MPNFTESVHLARPVDEVWAFIIDPNNHVVWDTAQQGSVQLGEGPFQAGVRWKGTSRVLGKKVEWTAEVTEVVENHKYVNHSVDTVPEFTITLTVAPDGDGTKLEFHIDAASGLGGLFGKLADPIVSRAYARNVRSGLDNLADVLSG